MKNAAGKALNKLRNKKLTAEQRKAIAKKAWEASAKARKKKKENG